MEIFMRILFCVFCLALTACSEPEKENAEVIRAIAWTKVEPTNNLQVRRLSGVIHAVEATNLSFQVGGRAELVKVKLGDTVKAGDVLAQLEQRSFLLKKQSSTANLQKAKASLVEAKNDYERYAQLLTKGLISQSGYDKSKSAFETALSAVDLATTELEISRKDIQDSVLTAPYNGKITKRILEPSMQVSAGQSVLEIEGDNGLEVQIMMPETLLNNIVKSSEVSIQYPAFALQHSIGIITEIGTRAQTANAFPVTVLITDPFVQLRAGMTAEVDFVFNGGGITQYKGLTFRIPITALGNKIGQETFVYVFDSETKTIKQRQVQIENIAHNDVLISSGLSEGEIIAIAGISFLRDGQSVNLFDKQVKTFN